MNWNWDWNWTRTVNKLTYKKAVKKLKDENIYEQDLKDISKETKTVKKVPKSEAYLKKLTLEKQDELNVPYKIYEDILSEKTSLFLPLLKLQVKVLESKIVNRTKKFVKKYIDKKSVQTLASETELVNKVISKTQINELKENLEKNYERYDYYNSRHQNNIKRIENELKLFKNLQKNVYSKNFTSKSFEFIDVNTRNQLKKNILKAVTKKSLSYKIDSLSENFFNDYIKKTSSHHYGLINKTFENYSRENVDKVFRKQVDLRHVSSDFSRDTFEYLTRDEVLKEDRNRQISKHIDFRKNLIKNVNQSQKERILKKYFEHYDVKKLKNIDKIFEKSDISTFTNILEEKFRNQNIINGEKIYRNIKNINKRLDTKIFVNKVFESLKNINAVSSVLTDFTSKKIDNLKIRNIQKVPKIIRNAPKLYSNINEVAQNELALSYFYQDKPHMVYKLKEKEIVQEQPKPEVKKVEKKEEKPPDIIIKKQVEPERIKKEDLNLIEKRLMTKTLSKKDVIDLIKSQLRDINIENISRFVIEKVQRRAAIDRKRNGIF